MLTEGTVGPQVISDGVQANLRLGKGAEVITTELHGKYYEQNYRGNLFHATVDTGGVALPVAGTSAGIALANPAGSGKNLSLVRVTLGIVSGTFVTGTIMHGVNTNTVGAAVTGTAITAVAGLIGPNLSPVGKFFKTATLPATQTALRPFLVKYAAGAGFIVAMEDIDGSIILTPGTTWSLYVVGADTTPLEVIGVSWEEIAI